MTRAADLAKLIAGGGTITVDDNSTNITLKSTDADADLGPVLDLLRDGASPADSDFIGQVRFQAKDDGGNVHEYAKILGQISDVTGGTEDGILGVRTILGGTDTRRIDLGVSETVFNEDSADLDFRVESDANTHALFLEGSSGNIGVNESSPESNSNYKAITISDSTGGQIYFKSTGGSVLAYVGADSSSSGVGYVATNTNHPLMFRTNNTDKMKLHTSGVVSFNDGIELGSGLDATAANILDDYEEGTFTATAGNSVTLYSNADLLYYTKIGIIVHITGQIRVNSDNSNSGLRITNFPFAHSANTESEGFTFGAVRLYNHAVPSGTLYVGCFMSPSTTQCYVEAIKDDAVTVELPADTQGYVMFGYTYPTDS